MDNFITNIGNKYKQGDILTRVIFVNIGVFLFVRLVGALFLLFNYDVSGLIKYLEFPSILSCSLLQPWSVITYMFVHYDVLHVLFNMLWLYWFGRIFLKFFDSRKLFGVYLLGGIFGALLFMLVYNVFPYFTTSASVHYLVGASASVMAIVFGVSFYAKNEEVALMFIGRVKIYYLALFTLLLDLLSVTSANAGGHIAHIGGALFGICYATSIRSGKDITKSLNKIIDRLVDLFSHKPRMRVTYKKPETDYEYNARKQRETEQIDVILDKLKRSGYQSLSSDEKKQLFDASKK